jgi:hypothetical protein
MTKDQYPNKDDSFDELYSKYTSIDAKKVTDSFFTATPEDLGKAYMDSQNRKQKNSTLDYELSENDKHWLNGKPQGKEIL